MKPYPSWVMSIALGMICAGILPMPLVYLLRRFQILKVDLDIHQGSIRRNETTASTKEMIDQDDDVSIIIDDDDELISIKLIKVVTQVYLTFVHVMNVLRRHKRMTKAIKFSTTEKNWFWFCFYLALLVILASQFTHETRQD